MKTIQKLLLAVALLAVPWGASATDLDQYLPSNWGGWQNLSLGTTDTTYYTKTQLPMDVQVSGQTIHVAWADWQPNAAGEYCLWYRRSTDAGRTWEAPRAIVKSKQMKMGDINYVGGNFGSNAKWMEVEGPNIHVVTIQRSADDQNSEVYYTSSHDGGQTFQTRLIADGSEDDGHFNYGHPHVVADGQTLVIAFNSARYNSTSYKTRVLTSFDGGSTFTDKTIDTTQDLVDLQVSGRQWAVLGNDMYWYYNMHWGNVYVSTSTDGGETITTQNVAPLVKDETSWCSLEYMKGFNGQSFNYHAQMTLEGDVINVIFQGCAEDLGDPHPTNDRNHTIFRRSTDFGKTWTKAMYLPESKNTYCAIAAKGQNIYVLSTPNGPRMYHSHDGGQTWETQPRCFWNSQYSGFANFFDLYLAPDDPTGQHVYLTTCRGLLVESKDGFRTVHRNFAVGYESWDSKDRNNHSLTVRVDSEGTEHWIMNYSAPYKAFDPYFWSIVYRRNDPAPATTGTEMALDISVSENPIINSPLNKVTIPMTPSIMETREAITVECWVRIDKRSSGSLDIAALSNSNGNHNSSPYNGGWYISVHQDGNQGYTFFGGVSTELSVDGKGKEVWDRWRYRFTETGMWHHVALTYDSRQEKDNIRFYIDGMLISTGTERGPIIMGNNPIVIGPNSVGGDYWAQETYVDNFALYSRALTEEEISRHIYNRPDATDKDCRLLLTFDGSLQDQSQYHNDPVPLLPNDLKAHDGIRPPHPEFTLTKDLTGQTVYLTDMTPDGEAYQWIKPDPWNLGRLDKYSTSKQRHDKQDVSGHPGLYNYWLIAKGTGDCNAYAATSQSIVVGGLAKVFPAEAAQSKGVRLRIQGGYNLTYGNQPKVVLKQGTREVEGKWLIEYGYDMKKAVQTADDLPDALFDMSAAPLGRYDVIVGKDTLRQAFTLTAEDYGEPDVWLQVNGFGRSIWNKYQRYTIDYGNRSDVPAYNTPFFLIIPDRHGTVDVSFEFDFELCNIALDDYGQELARRLGDHLMAYDEQTRDSVRIYSFMIPYIAPHSTNQTAFRIKMAPGTNEPSSEITMYFWAEQPWGPFDPDAPNPYEGATTRAPYTMEQGECFAAAMGLAAVETAIGFIPGVGCIYNAGKTIYQVADSKQRSWSSFLCNLVSTGLSCVAGPASVLGDLAFQLGSGVWNATAAGIGASDCLKGDPNSTKNRGVGSYDPNELIGPWGPDDARHYIRPIGSMAYTVTFENKASATAPAHEVFVADTLDLSKFDASTFSFTSYGWADTTLIVGGSYVHDFTRDVLYKVKGQDILVRVSGQFDPATGVARWSFVSLQKSGDEIYDPDLGFLLPNTADGVGEGFVGFSIEHKKSPANGATIANRASIVFDANAPIATNTYVNTFDTDYPTSKVTEAVERDGQLVIAFEGTDATSGIGHYTLYASVNGADFEPVGTRLTASPYVMPCQAGATYALCVVATDRVGWDEPKSLRAEQTVTTGGTPGPTPTTIALSVPAAGYATFFDAQHNYALPQGLKASVVSGYGSNTLRYEPLAGNIVPAGVAVLIEADAKQAATYTLTSTSQSAAYSGPNLLYGSDAATTTAVDGNVLYYKLTYGPSGTPLADRFGWFWGAPNGAPFRIDAHRAWLAVPRGAAATRGYLLDGPETAIELLPAPAADAPWFDLQGRRVTTPLTPGIYMHQGRKVVVR